MKKTIALAVIFIEALFLLTFNLTLSFAQEGKKSEIVSKPKKLSLYEKIESLTGSQGQLFEKEGVFKVGFPRSDLNVNIAGVKMTPPMGLGVWAAFKIKGNNTMVMGDMVLAEDQVNPVMSLALENGFEVTALHNHFLWDNPRVMFMHIGGMGDPLKLAAVVGKIFTKIKETAGGKGEKPYTEIDPKNTTLDPKKIEDILSAKGQLSSGVYKITFGRTTTMDGEEMGNAMGVNTWAAFTGSDEKAIVDGDFAMLSSEVQDVLKTLRKAGINIVAIHNHMIGESPQIIFLHFWGIGSTTDLAKGIKAALDTQQK